MTPTIEESLKEITDRTRRIETKVTRILTGEGDRGVTNASYKLTDKLGYRLELNSASVTAQQLAKILEAESVPTGELVAVYDNDRYMITITVED